MNDRFLKVDIAAVTFKGLSMSVDRKLALFNTVLIWFLTAAVLLYFLVSLIDENGGFVGFTVLLGCSVMILDYIFTNRFIPYSLAKFLVQYTPISSLYKQDMKVLDSAKLELLNVAKQVRFADYLVYSKINPDIRSEDSLSVMLEQRRGNLTDWVNHPYHLKQLANLVYQIYLVENFIKEDQDRF